MIHFLTTTLPKELQEPDVCAAAEALTALLRIKKPVEISVSFVTSARIQTLNTQYRKKRKPTDVLSFSTREGDLPKSIQSHTPSWGDVVICPSYVRTEAKRRSIPAREELLRVLVHGVLHLAGYDHVTEKDELKMFGLQERVVGDLVYADYV